MTPDKAKGLQAILKTYEGRVIGPPRRAADPVNLPMIRHWCQAMSETNPIYLDERAAQESGHPSIVAPPAMLQTWTHHDRRYSPPPPTSQYPEAQLEGLLIDSGFASIVATNSEQEYLRYLRCGDLLTMNAVIESVSQRKETAIGSGYFISTRYEYIDQYSEVVGRIRSTTYRYAPRAEGTPSPAPRRLAGPDTGQPDADHGGTSGGRQLPSVTISLTPTLIIAAAIASRDFHPVHHDRYKAVTLGLKDIIMNILTTNGLIARYVSDWAGARARLSALNVRLGAPNYPHDEMHLVAAAETLATSAASRTVRVAVRAFNSLGDHATGTADLEIPCSM